MEEDLKEPIIFDMKTYLQKEGENAKTGGLINGQQIKKGVRDYDKM